MTPRPLRPREDVVAYAACVCCGQAVLHGRTPEGQLVPLAVGIVTSVVLWPNETPLPALSGPNPTLVSPAANSPEPRTSSR